MKEGRPLLGIGRLRNVEFRSFDMRQKHTLEDGVETYPDRGEERVLGYGKRDSEVRAGTYTPRTYFERTPRTARTRWDARCGDLLEAGSPGHVRLLQ